MSPKQGCTQPLTMLAKNVAAIRCQSSRCMAHTRAADTSGRSFSACESHVTFFSAAALPPAAPAAFGAVAAAAGGAAGGGAATGAGADAPAGAGAPAAAGRAAPPAAPPWAPPPSPPDTSCSAHSARKRPASRSISSPKRPSSTTRPFASTAMRSAPVMVLRRCAMTRLVRFAPAPPPPPTPAARPDSRSSMAACTARSEALSSAEVASSSSRIRGFRSSARAMHTRCRWPPDSVVAVAVPHTVS